MRKKFVKSLAEQPEQDELTDSLSSENMEYNEERPANASNDVIEIMDEDREVELMMERHRKYHPRKYVNLQQPPSKIYYDRSVSMLDETDDTQTEDEDERNQLVIDCAKDTQTSETSSSNSSLNHEIQPTTSRQPASSTVAVPARSGPVSPAASTSAHNQRPSATYNWHIPQGNGPPEQRPKHQQQRASTFRQRPDTPAPKMMQQQLPSSCQQRRSHPYEQYSSGSNAQPATNNVQEVRRRAATPYPRAVQIPPVDTNDANNGNGSIDDARGSAFSSPEYENHDNSSTMPPPNPVPMVTGTNATGVIAPRTPLYHLPPYIPPYHFPAYGDRANTPGYMAVDEWFRFGYTPPHLLAASDLQYYYHLHMTKMIAAQTGVYQPAHDPRFPGYPALPIPGAMTLGNVPPAYPAPQYGFVSATNVPECASPQHAIDYSQNNSGTMPPGSGYLPRPVQLTSQSTPQFQQQLPAGQLTANQPSFSSPSINATPTFAEPEMMSSAPSPAPFLATQRTSASSTFAATHSQPYPTPSPSMPPPGSVSPSRSVRMEPSTTSFFLPEIISREPTPAPFLAPQMAPSACTAHSQQPPCASTHRQPSVPSTLMAPPGSVAASQSVHSGFSTSNFVRPEMTNRTSTPAPFLTTPSGSMPPARSIPLPYNVPSSRSMYSTPSTASFVRPDMINRAQTPAPSMMSMPRATSSHSQCVPLSTATMSYLQQHTSTVSTATPRPMAPAVNTAYSMPPVAMRKQSPMQPPTMRTTTSATSFSTSCSMPPPSSMPPPRHVPSSCSAAVPIANVPTFSAPATSSMPPVSSMSSARPLSSPSPMPSAALMEELTSMPPASPMMAKRPMPQLTPMPPSSSMQPPSSSMQGSSATTSAPSMIPDDRSVQHSTPKPPMQESTSIPAPPMQQPTPIPQSSSMAPPRSGMIQSRSIQQPSPVPQSSSMAPPPSGMIPRPQPSASSMPPPPILQPSPMPPASCSTSMQTTTPPVSSNSSPTVPKPSLIPPPLVSSSATPSSSSMPPPSWHLKPGQTKHPLSVMSPAASKRKHPANEPSPMPQESQRPATPALAGPSCSMPLLSSMRSCSYHVPRQPNGANPALKRNRVQHDPPPSTDSIKNRLRSTTAAKASKPIATAMIPPIMNDPPPPPPPPAPRTAVGPAPNRNSSMFISLMRDEMTAFLMHRRQEIMSTMRSYSRGGMTFAEMQQNMKRHNVTYLDFMQVAFAVMERCGYDGFAREPPPELDYRWHSPPQALGDYFAQNNTCSPRMVTEHFEFLMLIVENLLRQYIEPMEYFLLTYVFGVQSSRRR